ELVQGCGFRRRGGIGEAGGFTATDAAPALADIACDGGEPGLAFVEVAQLVLVAPRLHEGLLGEGLGGVAGPRTACAVARQPELVGLGEGGERDRACGRRDSHTALQRVDRASIWP